MTGPMTHLDADALAEFRAGLITGRRGARMAAHLAGCDRCSARDGELGELSAVLAAVPVPAIPDRVASRLDTVLAAEVAHRDQAERARADGSHDGASRRRSARKRNFRLVAMRVLAPAGAAAVLAAGGYGLSQIGGGPGHMTAASSAAGRSVQPAAGRAAGPAQSAPAQPARAQPALGGTGPRSLRRSAASFPVVTSPADFSAAGLSRLIQADLRVPPRPGATQAASPAVQACVRKVAGGAALVRVEKAHFEGRPATVIVARTSQGEKAWITVPDCSATGRYVLATTTLPTGISGS